MASPPTARNEVASEAVDQQPKGVLMARAPNARGREAVCRVGCPCVAVAVTRSWLRGMRGCGGVLPFAGV